MEAFPEWLPPFLFSLCISLHGDAWSLRPLKMYWGVQIYSHGNIWSDLIFNSTPTRKYLFIYLIYSSNQLNVPSEGIKVKSQIEAYIMYLVLAILVMQVYKNCRMTEVSIKVSEEEFRCQVMCSMFDSCKERWIKL